MIPTIAPRHGPAARGPRAVAGHVAARSGRKVLGACLAFVLASPAAGAADAPLWEVGAGLGVLRMPDYRGSRQSHDWVLPLPYVIYRGAFLRADREGARALLLRTERVSVDLSAWAGPPTRDGASGVREGMAPLPPTIEVGPRLNLRLGEGSDWRLDLRVPLRSVLALDSGLRRVGWSLETLVNADLRRGDWNFGAQAGALWGDGRLHRHLYGVAPREATATRPAYDAGAGRAGWQATASVSRRFGRLWAGAFVRHDRVTGTAFDASPLLQRRAHTEVGLGVSWVFAVSDERVPDID